tara:strand:+ start:54 stop:1226 length:1173 start_codon:yes stop_codon:yes gene_type:complete
MALTITSQPNELGTGVITSSPYRPTFVEVSSDSAAIVRVIADVYVEGILKGTVEKEPVLGTTDNFKIEIGEIDKKYLDSEFHNTALFLEVHENIISAKEFKLLIYEVTEVGGLLVTNWEENGTGIADKVTSDIYQFNGVNNHLQDLTQRFCDGITKKFLTNRPQNSNIINNQIYHCGILPDTEGYNTLISVEEFDGNNGTGTSLSVTASTNLSVGRRKASYTIDTTQLNVLTKSIIYHIKDGFTSLQITEFFTVNVVSECNDEINLFWQNHWGQFDQYFFAGNQTQNTKNKTKSIVNRLPLDYNVEQRGKRDIKKINTREFEMFTRTENPEVVEWLAEIGESVDVYIMIGTDRVAINVKSVTTNIVDEDDVVVQINIKYTLSNERINQIG